MPTQQHWVPKLGHWSEWLAWALAWRWTKYAIDEIDSWVFCVHCNADTVDPGHENWCCIGHAERMIRSLGLKMGY